MTTVKCQKAGQNIISLTVSPLACQGCGGEIKIVRDERGRIIQVIAPVIEGGFWSYPRKASAGFDCPATTADPEASDLVKPLA